jgi:hypothetical protein
MNSRLFPFSAVTTVDGTLEELYHGTTTEFDRFDAACTADGGLHFGTLDQARVRVAGPSKQLLKVNLNIQNPQRSRDTGASWKSKIRAAKALGHDGIVYLNRFEGILQETIARADKDGINLDGMADRDFRKFAPEAKDSWIAFNAAQVVVLERIPSSRLSSKSCCVEQDPDYEEENDGNSATRAVA